jgi:hypothetical protein
MSFIMQVYKELSRCIFTNQKLVSSLQHAAVHVQHHVGDFFFHLATSHRTTSLEAECIIVDDFSFFSNMKCDLLQCTVVLV